MNTEIKEAVTEFNPQTQIAPSVEALPDVIELTVSEVDRQTARDYNDTRDCLICTALKNRGINVLTAGGYTVRLEDGSRYAGNIGDEDLCATPAASPPFYGPEVVGKVIRLRKA